MTNLKIKKIAIACFKNDIYLVRACVASIRYWYPDVEIYLIKDLYRGDFSTEEIEETFHVKIFQTTRSHFGWPWAKLSILLPEEKGRWLFLDADTVFLGKVLDRLDEFDDDFIVTGVKLADENSQVISYNYVNVSKIRDFDPDYKYPGFGVNTGQMVVTTGVFNESDFGRLIDFSTPMRNKHPEIFMHGDQGILNYVYEKARQAGKITLRYVDFWIWPGLPEADEISLGGIRNKEGIPYVLHWAGLKPVDFRRLKRYDIFSFFEESYYKSVKGGSLKRIRRYYSRLFIVGLKIFKYKIKGISYPK